MRNATKTRCERGVHKRSKCNAPARARLVAAMPAVAASLLIFGTSKANEDDQTGQTTMFCSATAQALFRACGNEAGGDYWVAFGICINESDDQQREACVAEAKRARSEARQLCNEQLAGRRDTCGSLGEGRYDPDFAPASFDSNFGNLSNPNQYFPLGIGNEWEFRSDTQTTKVEVLKETKLIDGVRCIAVRDEVKEDGDLIESTNDWYAQAKDGTVWYCGEETSSFESFEGDQPRKPELVSIEGSFKAGRDGDKPGIIFLATPSVGKVYVEESSLGNAEDATEVLSTTYTYGENPELDQLVPPKLAQLVCNADCVVTKNFSLLEPGVFERKYYAPGIGVFLEVEPQGEEVVRLVKCNVDPRCSSLPQ